MRKHLKKIDRSICSRTFFFFVHNWISLQQSKQTGGRTDERIDDNDSIYRHNSIISIIIWRKKQSCLSTKWFVKNIFYFRLLLAFPARLGNLDGGGKGGSAQSHQDKSCLTSFLSRSYKRCWRRAKDNGAIYCSLLFGEAVVENCFLNFFKNWIQLHSIVVHFSSR